MTDDTSRSRYAGATGEGPGRLLDRSVGVAREPLAVVSAGAWNSIAQHGKLLRGRPAHARKTRTAGRPARLESAARDTQPVEHVLRIYDARQFR